MKSLRKSKGRQFQKLRWDIFEQTWTDWESWTVIDKSIDVMDECKQSQSRQRSILRIVKLSTSFHWIVYLFHNYVLTFSKASRNHLVIVSIMEKRWKILKDGIAYLFLNTWLTAIWLNFLETKEKRLEKFTLSPSYKIKEMLQKMNVFLRLLVFNKTDT